MIVKKLGWGVEYGMLFNFKRKEGDQRGFDILRIDFVDPRFFYKYRFEYDSSNFPASSRAMSLIFEFNFARVTVRMTQR